MISNGLRQGPTLGALPAVLPIVGRVLWYVGLPAVLIGGSLYGVAKAAEAANSSLPINWKNIPKASISGGIGAASYAAAPLVPESYRPFAYVITALGAAGAIYFLFSDVVSGTVHGTRPSGSGSYQKIQATIDSPKEWEKIPVGGWMAPRPYRIGVTWQNRGDEIVPFHYRFKVSETPVGVWGQGETITYETTPMWADRKLESLDSLELGPGEALPIRYELPLKSLLTWPVSAPVEMDLRVEVLDQNANAWVPVSGQRSFLVG